MRSSKQRIRSAGFSFIELLITLAVFSILVGAVFGFFSSQRDTYLLEGLRLERDQNLRVAAETLFSELSTAGYLAADAEFIDNLPQWVVSTYIPSEPLSVTLDANPKVTLGEGSLPDVVTFAGGVPTDSNPTSLSGETDGISITVALSNSDSETQYKPGDIVAVGYIPEYARVVAVDGNVLTVDADPEAPGDQPLSTHYPAGTAVEEISIVSYTVFNDQNDPEYKRHDAGRPLLKRKINAAGFYPVAENIVRIKVIETEEGVLQVALKALAGQGRYDAAGTGQRTVTERVLLRNGLKAGLASDCTKPEAPGAPVVAGGLDESFPCQVSISWDPVTKDASGISMDDTGCPVTGYRIYFDEVPETFGNYLDVSNGDASGCIVDVSGIPSARLYVSVAAENSGGLGEKSPETAVDDLTPPDKTMGFSATADGVDKVTLFWDENSECDLSGYYIYRKKNGGSLTLAAGLVPAGSCVYTDTGLEAGASYTYTIEAVDFSFNTGEMSEAVTASLP